MTMEELVRALKHGYVIRCPTDADRVDLVNEMESSGDFVVSSTSRIAKPYTDYPYIRYANGEDRYGRMILSGTRSDTAPFLRYDEVYDMFFGGEPLQIPTGEAFTAALDALLS